MTFTIELVEEPIPVRPSWKEYGLCMAIMAATRSTCLTRKVGAALLLENKVIATGYNGAAAGKTTCLDLSVCLYRQSAYEDTLANQGLSFVDACRNRKSECIAAHAEVNALKQCVLLGVHPKNAILYVTAFPCPDCVRKHIIPSGIGTVVAMGLYQSRSVTEDQTSISKKLLEEAGIVFEVGGNTEYVFEPI
jgi:dCMP deaminase